MNNQQATVSTLAVFAMLATLPSSSGAEVVHLYSEDGEISISGEIIASSDDEYTVQTALGQMVVAADRVSCEGSACPATGTAGKEIRVSMAPMLTPDLILPLVDIETSLSDVLSLRNGGQVTVTGVVQSDAHAFAALAEGSTELAFTTRRATERERDALGLVEDNGLRLAPVLFAAVVDLGNDISMLSLSALRDIYTGRISNWSELGGPDLGIEVATYPDGSALRSSLEELLFSGEPGNANPQHRVVETSEEAVAFVQDNSAAIAIVPHAMHEGLRTVETTNRCGIPVSASFSGPNPLAHQVFLYARQSSEDSVLPEFTGSLFDQHDLTAQPDAIAPRSMAPLEIWATEQSEIGSGQQASAYREFLAAQVGYERLPITFHFEQNSLDVDAAAREHLGELLEYLDTLPRGTSVRLVGFTDSYGSFGVNRGMSLLRAMAVLDAVADASSASLDMSAFSAVGFGEIAPIHCNDTIEGRDANRRVEVWVASGNGS